jgi:hypothetical protein
MTLVLTAASLKKLKYAWHENIEIPAAERVSSNIQKQKHPYGNPGVTGGSITHPAAGPRITRLKNIRLTVVDHDHQRHQAG